MSPTRWKTVIESIAFLIIFIVTIVITLYLPDNLAIDIASGISRPYPVDNQYPTNTIQYHLQKSSQDVTKTPACSSLYVVTSTLYLYTIYLITMSRYQRKDKEYELLYPL